ncbi:SDR family NAD(P)-dependent oxidoreductase [Xanthovirga aplysinae]|uniref:SDR family NAD(P)-dependent oxidoreductase n=1 Tax=Xanthovirga aplysinae TaxID=2529853 RepID=UPI0012BBAC2A|nr:SDR family NAD(P)-dependent oxidoreductase [Xanthovirga aplysinae]MTI33174.1 SDR family NAD(P)-dependent oxidoreductase [Xanthovirga aplysinae]
MQTTDKKFALVTGASKGLGKELTLALAKRKINLITVALENEGLPSFCEELKKEFGIEAYPYETNLANPNEVYKLSKWLQIRFPINLLINNAGIGGTSSFEKSDPAYLETIIQLNIRALILLCRLLLPELKKHPKAYILNVSSMAAFCPMGHKTIYPASKAFIYSFSRGLAEELKDTSISVSVLTPGPMYKDFKLLERRTILRPYANMGLTSPKLVANFAIENLFKRKKIIIPGKINQLDRFLMKILPEGLLISFFSRIMRNEVKE